LVYDEVVRSLIGVELEQRTHLGGQIPTIEKYLEIRDGTHGVGTLLALVEYVNKLPGHRNITDDPVLKSLWDETELIVWL
jgi:hypothetical protein